MHITLIQPRIGTSGTGGTIAPLAMAILAHFTPKHITVQFFDESVEEIPADLSTDLVAMSVTTFTAKRAYTLADHFRTRGIKVVMGGVHPSLMTEEALQHADSIVKGAGELIWPQVLRDAQNEALQKVYIGNNGAPLVDLLPDRSIFKDKKYGPLNPVQFGRGCQFSCDFCSVHALYGSEVRHRPVSEVIDEIVSLQSKMLFFVDDNIHSYSEGSIELLESLSHLKINWFGQASINAARDPETVKLLRKSGCMGLIIGFESLEKGSLTQMGKSVNLRNDYIRAVDLLQRNGIMIAGSFIFGYNNEKKSTITDALEFSIQKNFVHAYFNPIIPTPGTKLYDRLLYENRFFDPVWWLSDTFKYGRLPFQTIGITPEELEMECMKARWKFDSFLSILKRSFGAKSNWHSFRNLFLFWLSNLMYRKEYRRKYGKQIF
jgi:radical SAM superfamily enzyme YgiQ (UPF0313 family)